MRILLALIALVLLPAAALQAQVDAIWPASDVAKYKSSNRSLTIGHPDASTFKLLQRFTKLTELHLTWRTGKTDLD